MTSVVSAAPSAMWYPSNPGSTSAPTVSMLWTIRYFNRGRSWNSRSSVPLRSMLGTSYQWPTGCRHCMGTLSV